MFPSRLPKSTTMSVRRPSAPNDGSTSFGFSGIPVSVKKANLFTPKPERSHSSLAASTARKPYMTTDKKRSSKPDPDEQVRMFKTLSDFVKSIAPNFPMPEAKRFLASVSSTEVTRIFEVLINQMNPNFKIKNLDQDVRKQLERIGYPNQIGKHALVAIASRQAVGALLVIYDWLVGYIKSLEPLEDLENIEFEIEDNIKFESLMIDPVGEDGDVWLQQALIELYPTEDCEADFDECEAIEEEIKQIDYQKDKIEEINEAEEVFATNTGACLKFNNDMEAYIKNLYVEVEKAESHSLDAQMDMKKGELQDYILKTINIDEETISGKKIALLKNELQLTQQAYQEMDVDKIEQRLISENRDEARQVEEIRENYKKDLDVRRKEEKDMFDRLKLEEAEDAKLAKLNLDYVKSLLGSYREQAEAIVQREERETEYWNEVGQILRQNNETAKMAMKMLRSASAK